MYRTESLVQYFPRLAFLNFIFNFITRGRKAPESRFRLCFLLLLFVFSVLQISCAVTKPKLGLSLGTKVKICCTTVSRWRLSGVGRYWSLMFFGFFLLINSSSRLTLYRRIVAVKATIDMQSPHAKLLCLNISNEVEISSFWSWQKI